MKSSEDYETVLAVIEFGIEKARLHPKPGEPVPSDDYTAWVIINELRRAGWTISRISN